VGGKRWAVGNNDHVKTIEGCLPIGRMEVERGGGLIKGVGGEKGGTAKKEGKKRGKTQRPSCLAAVRNTPLCGWDG